MENRAIKRAVVFLAVLMFRIVATGKVIHLSDVDFLKLTRLKDRDFSLFEGGEINMADEYIRKEDAKDALQEKVFHDLTDEFYGAMQVLDELEPADVAPVVRCDDCVYYGSRRWCELHSSVFDDNAFCSYGEKREE